MERTRKLILCRETLTELTGDDLRAVVGGQTLTQCVCGTVVTCDCPVTFATCTCPTGQSCTCVTGPICDA